MGGSLLNLMEDGEELGGDLGESSTNLVMTEAESESIQGDQEGKALLRIIWLTQNNV